MALSQEILDEIVGHLHRDKRTLQTLTVTSSKFLPISREFLFNPFCLRGNNAAVWDTRLQTCPDLCHALKEIDVQTTRLLRKDVPNIVNVLNRIVSPRKLILRNTRIPKPFPKSWIVLPNSLQDALTGVLLRPTMTAVTIECLILPISFFKNIPHLRDIRLLSCRFERGSSSDASQTPPIHQIPLTTFTINGSREVYTAGQQSFYEIFDHPKLCLDGTNLVRLEVELLPENFEKVEELISRCSKRLRYLSLCMLGGWTSVHDLPALRSLEIKLDVTNPSMNEENMNLILSGFNRTLESITASSQPTNNQDNPNISQNDDDLLLNNLQEIRLVTLIYPPQYRKISEEFWKNLDSVLGDRIPPTIGITIVTRPYRAHWLEMPDWWGLLPILDDSGRLTLVDEDSECDW